MQYVNTGVRGGLNGCAKNVVLMHTETSILLGQKPGSKKHEIFELQHESRW